MSWEAIGLVLAEDVELWAGQSFDYQSHVGLGIENRFRFQNRILKVRNRILVVKLKFQFRLSIPMRFFSLHLLGPV